MSKVYQIITDRIIAAIESDGLLPWRKPWAGGAMAPRNLKSGKAYRGINVFLLGSLGYASPFFVSFKQAKQLGGHVKKGEQGTPVIFWLWPDEKRKAEAAAAGRQAFPIIRYYQVFNTSQCEGITHKRLTEWEEEQKTERPEHEKIEAAAAVVAGWEDSCPIEYGMGQAYYSPAADKIGMPAAEAFETGPAFYCTLFHEMAHATGHSKRLNRFPADTASQAFGSESYSEEELTAEMAASFLAAESGIDAAAYLDQSAAYVASWLQRLKGDSKLVVQAASRAQKAADSILGRTFA
jgi:antirestriction protein ArdC